MKPNLIDVFVTSRDTTDRLAHKEPLFFRDDVEETEFAVVNVYDEVRYQEWIGFGGAFTEAAALTFDQLPPAVREQVMEAYFDPQRGQGYNFCRTHMNSCDFSLGNYADAAQPGDVALESFNVTREKEHLFPMIQQAARRASFKLFISPWSPPAWMKDSGAMNQGGKLLPQYADSWALHYVRFIEALKAEGLDVWGLTVQNEPNATQTWDSCTYTAQEEAEFVANHLYPALARAGLDGVRIMVWDHNKERVYERARDVLANPQAAEHVWGIAFHWYSGDHFEALDLVHTRWPEKALVFTEGCVDRDEGFDAWGAGESYAHDILGDLNHYTQAWCDWNLLLDYEGGPNHVRNFCSAPLMATEDYQRVLFQPSYWYMGHFSRFIPAGSVRIGCTRYTPALECTAFLRPDGKRTLVALNRSDAAIPFTLRWCGKMAEAAILPHSIQTLLF
jgi:glucosylceramidase